MKKLILIVLLLFFSVQNSFAGTFMFRSKASLIQSWLNAKGYGGSVYDGLNQYFAEKSTLTNGTLYDNVMNVLGQGGYEGTMSDRLNGFFASYGGETGFWSNSSNDFIASTSGGFIFVDGNNFVFVDGNNFIFVE